MTYDVENMSDEEILRALEYEASQEVLYDNLQMAMKILLNAGYGAVGNSSFLYFKIENAAAITLSGQLVNKWTNKRINEFLNQILNTPGAYRTLAGDTDSLYLCLEDVVKKLKLEGKDEDTITDKLDEFCKKIMSPKIDSYTKDLCEYMNGMRNKMVWEREVISPISIYVRKKGYTMMVKDSEGVRYSTPKMKITGLEAIKAGQTPEWARNFLKKCYEVGLTGSEKDLQALVKKIKAEFDKFSPNEIAVPRGVNGLEQYSDEVTIYTKGTPKNVKAALIHNHLIKQKGLGIPPIQSGNKIKYLELKKPNPIDQEVIGFSYFLPEEFGLAEYVDRTKIFEGSFIAPLEIFLTAIKWNWEETISLFDF